MRIALVSKLWEETSPLSDGGTGMVVGCLAEELAKLGHEVTVFGVGSSRITVKINSVTANPITTYDESLHYWNIQNAFREHKSFDVINCWVDQTAVHFSELIDTPSIHTIDYGDLSKSAIRLLTAHKNLPYIAISEAMKELIPDLGWLKVIYNGTQTMNFPYSEKAQDYYYFIGRMSPTKGPDKAIKAAIASSKPLILVGKTRPEYDGEYLKSAIYPFINGNSIIHHETADFAMRVNLYQNAKALINPISYLEAFGLTMTEAMSCGTPVIAFDNGAAPEIVEDGKTGFLVNYTNQQNGGKWITKRSGIDGLVEAMSRLENLNPKDYMAMRRAARDRVEKYFSVESMAKNYEQVFSNYIG